MKNFFSTAETIIVLSMFVMLGSIFYGLEYRTYAARAYHSNVIDRIQSSLYDQDVIQECIEEAENKGYTLVVEDMTIYDERRDIKVTMTYKVPIWLSDEYETGTLVGYAR